MNNYDHIRLIFSRYMEGSITTAERAELSEAAENYSTKEWEEILEPIITSAQADPNFNIADWEKEIQFILSAKPGVSFGSPQEDKKIIRMFSWRKFAVAASIIAIVGIVVVGILTNNHKTTTPPVEIAHDVPAPKETRAVITLANGTKVYLDSVDNGTIAQENNVNVVKSENGAISYQPLAISQQPTTYNTLFNPKGSKVVALTLSDGTKVWLNSESSLRYPASFAPAAVREVEITGEAYFEVKHNAKQPFKVHLPNGSVVEDIGTSFNINSYPDEDAIKTTLIEGSVRITAANAASAAVTIKPGQQAVFNPSIRVIRVQNNVDVDAVLAWKNGLFQFTNADIKTVMRQLARWYDIEVVYEGNIPVRKFEGKIQRDLSLADVLEPLARNQVHFKIEGKKITITP